MGTIIGVLDKNGEDSTETAITMLKTLQTEKAEAFGIASPSRINIKRNVEDLKRKRLNSNLIVGHVFSKTLNTDKPQPIELENATLVFDGRIYPLSNTSSADDAAQKLQCNREEAVKNLITETEGDFAFIIAETSRLVAGRDTIGLRPLYYGENLDLVALASERKALWKIGLDKTCSFPPGHIAFVYKKGFRLKTIKRLTYSKPSRTTMQTAVKELQTLLQHSVKERVSGLKDLAVAFSGGLDSSLIAFLAKKHRSNVHLIHVSLENQQETEHAREAAEQLKLPIYICLFKEANVEQILPEVLWTIEEADPINTSIAIPLHWAAEKAANMKLKVMLAGQGADELFGGYKKYVDDYLLHGGEAARKIFHDIIRLHDTNLERDFKTCNHHNVELRLPFATHELAKFATDLPINLKIEPQQNGPRKLVLRQTAKNLGLPDNIVKKPKKAIQYTTGVDKALKRIARKQGLPIKEYLHRIFQQVVKKRTHHE
jgi:asparagine synthase (glutamine-hydrolysing)